MVISDGLHYSDLFEALQEAANAVLAALNAAAGPA